MFDVFISYSSKDQKIVDAVLSRHNGSRRIASNGFLISSLYQEEVGVVCVDGLDVITLRRPPFY